MLVDAPSCIVDYFIIDHTIVVLILAQKCAILLKLPYFHAHFLRKLLQLALVESILLPLQLLYQVPPSASPFLHVVPVLLPYLRAPLLVSRFTHFADILANTFVMQTNVLPALWKW